MMAQSVHEDGHKPVQCEQGNILKSSLLLSFEENLRFLILYNDWTTWASSLELNRWIPKFFG